VIVKKNGKRGSFRPIFVKLWKLTVAVMPEGKVNPENRRVFRKGPDEMISCLHAF
jgi:hypothetical protein